MKETARRYYSSLVLLAVFLPMLVLSSLHVHPLAHPDGNHCEECVHHVLVFTAKRFIHITPQCRTAQGVVAGVRGVVFGRAPPVSCMFTGEN